VRVSLEVSSFAALHMKRRGSLNYFYPERRVLSGVVSGESHDVFLKEPIQEDLVIAQRGHRGRRSAPSPSLLTTAVISGERRRSDALTVWPRLQPPPPMKTHSTQQVLHKLLLPSSPRQCKHKVGPWRGGGGGGGGAGRKGGGVSGTQVIFNPGWWMRRLFSL